MTGASNDERILALFTQQPRLSFEDVVKLSPIPRFALLQTLTRLVDKGLVRKEKVERGKNNVTTYFELRKP